MAIVRGERGKPNTDSLPAIQFSGNVEWLLNSRAAMARQRLGQHFLADAGWREQLARAIGVSPHGMETSAPAAADNYCWIEVGAGHGEMTEHLLRSGAPVYAVELDKLLIARLQRLAQKHANLTVVADDVLETDLRAIAAGRRKI